jgi:hypothetical protein
MPKGLGFYFNHVYQRVDGLEQWLEPGYIYNTYT